MTAPVYTSNRWSINEWPQGDAEIRIGSRGTPRICTVHLRHVSINEQRANAHLIAAAPELFEALKQAVARIALANYEGDPILSAWLPEAVAAITKAEGKS